MAVYENDAFFCLFRYDIKMKIAKCLLFVKFADYSERRLMRISEVQEWLESQRQTLDRHPLMVLNAILGVMQSRAHEYMEWRIKVNNMESQLGVTKYAEALREGRYEEISHDFELLNADIAGLSNRAANNALSASTMLEHAKALQRLVAICDEYEVRVGENQTHTRAKITSEQGWVYLLVCLLATVCTLALWIVWYVWGRKVLETSRLSRLGQRGKFTSASADARTKPKAKNLVQRLRARLRTLSGDIGDTPGS
jgi:hypothetical protein